MARFDIFENQNKNKNNELNFTQSVNMNLNKLILYHWRAVTSKAVHAIGMPIH